MAEKKFDPDKDFSVVHGHSVFAYLQDRVYYDRKFVPQGEQPKPPHHATMERVRRTEAQALQAAKKIGDVGAALPIGKVADNSEALKENATSLAVEEEHG